LQHHGLSLSTDMALPESASGRIVGRSRLSLGRPSFGAGVGEE